MIYESEGYSTTPILTLLILEPPELEDVGVPLVHIDLVEETFDVSAQRDSVLSEAENDPQQAV